MSAAVFGGVAGLLSVLVFVAIHYRQLVAWQAEENEELKQALLKSRESQKKLLDELCKQSELLSALSRKNADIAILVAIIARLDKQEENGRWN